MTIQQSNWIPEIKFERTRLDNGLEVIIHENHATPIVCVNVWYHVGSKNERPGRTGFAHLFEHMMFQGSKNHDSDYFGPLQKAGGQLNGSTSIDRTNYWETVPSNYLEMALWLESDRMGLLLPAMTQEKLDNQREVVKNERRQSYENRPYGLAHETMLAALYPPDHPYSWPTIGSMEDIDGASRQDVADFFRTYYHPGNATLCLAGHFDPARALDLIDKYFGPLPSGPNVEPVSPQSVTLKGDQRISMTDRVGLPRLYMTWHTVPWFGNDDAELDILANILSVGKSSRLNSTLVRDKEVAQSVQTGQRSSQLTGSFSIIATGRPNQSLNEIEELIFEQIEQIQKHPPSHGEIERSINRTEAQFVRSMDSVSGFRGIADQLNSYNHYAGDPGFARKDFARYLRIKPEDIQRVALKYLRQPKVVLEVKRDEKQSINPDPCSHASERRRQIAAAVQFEPVPESPDLIDSFDRSVMPRPGATPGFSLPPIQESKLSNGAKVLLVPNHKLPTVNINLVIPFGRTSDPFELLGRGGLTAAVLDEGTTSRSATEISDSLADIGASLLVSSSRDSTSIRLFSLKRQLESALAVFGDVLLHPSFPDEELEREKRHLMGQLLRIREEPTVLARLAVNQILYGFEHPYGTAQFGTARSLQKISRSALVECYEEHFRPDIATLIVVGDITMKDTVRALESAIGAWRAPAKSAPVITLRQPAQLSRRRVVLIDKPGSAQSVISVSQLTAPRKVPDYFSLVVMNNLLGGQFSSRLNLNLREEKGYTYGARSSFDWRPTVPSPFSATASVQTKVTADALTEFLKELSDVHEKRPPSQAELDFAKASITRGYPANFETPGDLASRMETLIEYDLEIDYYNSVVPSINKVSINDTISAIGKHIDRDKLCIVVVGDRSEIEQSLRDHREVDDLELFEFDENFKLQEVERKTDSL